MKPSEWARAAGLLSRLWPHRPMDPAAVEAWYPLLADLDVEAVVEAIHRCALAPDGAWPPSVGELREASRPARRPWEDGLADLRKLISRASHHEPRPEVPDPALASVVESMGWDALRNTDLANSTARAQFRDAYTRAQERLSDGERRELASVATSQALSSGQWLRALPRDAS